METRGGPRPAPGTLTQLFFDAVAKFNRPDALQVKVGGTYRPISHDDVVKRVRYAARGMTGLGARRGDRIAILSENRPEWAIADYACLTAGFADVPVYPHFPLTNRIHPEVRRVGIFVSNREQGESSRNQA